MTVAHLNAVATANPPHDVHRAFETFVEGLLNERRDKALFRRMAGRSGIEHRYSFFEPVYDPNGFVADREGFYTPGAFPPTSKRMARYAATAPGLAADAIAKLDLDPESITHLVVASCTGFMAPGLDQVIVEKTGMNPGVERSVLGFMGCYAAVNSLRTAHHIVRSTPDARVLVVNLELCSLHFQDVPDLERLLSMLLFGDGATAALVTADASGLALTDFRAVALPDSAGLITWDVGDSGFDMHLSGEVPQRIQKAMAAELARNDDGGILRGQRPEDYPIWAVHAGGRAILDAVETGLGLGATALQRSRDVLREFGNMSSATLMFVLARILASRPASDQAGLGMAFGPGLAAESFRFRTV
ncbi:type III polyketide synthase [Sandaracinobacteroides saxicola]|uniref:Type III polyketide synthase n=1 Tax=Sandaracinobacteroides saxicola TaxID=2759707 RepID=A0A7G5IF25_9SPHN|nr:type III polyketide synthase [Sandaracinobacteroides saxicola]QMW21967.1 type III polyketide synthase [Sandaracinobacteroides saxicola]